MPADWERRAQLGERLATELEQDGVCAQVVDLLLDQENTAVTYRTARALLERRDRIGVELIVAAEAQADPDTSQWLSGAISGFRATSLGADDDFLRAALAELAKVADAAQAQAATQLLDEIG